MKKYSLVLAYLITFGILGVSVEWFTIFNRESLDPITLQNIILTANSVGSLIPILLAFYSRSQKDLTTLADIIMAINIFNLINILIQVILIMTR